MTDFTFEAPGPGTWTLDKSHMATPVSGALHAIARGPFAEGFNESMRRYGTVIASFTAGLAPRSLQRRVACVRHAQRRDRGRGRRRRIRPGSGCFARRLRRHGQEVGCPAGANPRRRRLAHGHGVPADRWLRSDWPDAVR